MIGYNGGKLEDIVFRRCTIRNSYTAGDGFAQGLYMHMHERTLVEENTFYHNGWYSYAGSGGIGQATVFHHDLYTWTMHDFVVSRNVFMHASSLSLKIASDGTRDTTGVQVLNNLFVAGEVGMSIGGNSTGAERFENMTVKGNVITNVDYDNPTKRGLGWGAEFQSWDGGLVEGNYFLNWDDPDVDNIYAVVVQNGMLNTAFKDNVVYRFNPNGTSDGAYVLQVQSAGTKSGNELTGNVFQQPGQQMGQVYFAASGDVAGFSKSGNVYHASNQLFRIGSTTYNFAGWVTASGDDSTFGEYGWPNSAPRTLPAYMASIGGTETVAGFIAAAAQISRANWDARFTAAAVAPFLMGE
jgi:hypothetical protein